MSADSIVPNPANPQSLNRFAYVFNRPTILQDPTGHDPWWEDREPATPGWNYACSCQRDRNEYKRVTVLQKHRLNSNIASAKFISQVRAAAFRFKLPPALVAANLYAEMNSRWIKDDIEDASVLALINCGGRIEVSCSALAFLGDNEISHDRSVGPAKLKPSAILDADVTVPSLKTAGMRIPADTIDAAAQALDFNTAVLLSAARLKGLADIRKLESPGSGNSRENDMTMVDMQAVRTAYNASINEGFGSVAAYQAWSTFRPDSVGTQAKPWIEAFTELFE